MASKTNIVHIPQDHDDFLLAVSQVGHGDPSAMDAISAFLTKVLSLWKKPSKKVILDKGSDVFAKCHLTRSTFDKTPRLVSTDDLILFSAVNVYHESSWVNHPPKMEGSIVGPTGFFQIRGSTAKSILDRMGVSTKSPLDAARLIHKDLKLQGQVYAKLLATYSAPPSSASFIGQGPANSFSIPASAPPRVQVLNPASAKEGTHLIPAANFTHAVLSAMYYDYRLYNVFATTKSGQYLLGTDGKPILDKKKAGYVKEVLSRVTYHGILRNT